MTTNSSSIDKLITILTKKLSDRTPPDEFIYTRSHYFLDDDDVTLLYLMFDVAENVRFSIEIVIGDGRWAGSNHHIRGLKVEEYQIKYRKKYILFGETTQQRHYKTVAEYRTAQSTSSPLKDLLPVSKCLKNLHIHLATVENLEQNKKIINNLNNIKF